MLLTKAIKSQVYLYFLSVSISCHNKKTFAAYKKGDASLTPNSPSKILIPKFTKKATIGGWSKYPQLRFWAKYQ